jgi:glycosyltransferase involved in cell wall biosynthesis
MAGKPELIICSQYLLGGGTSFHRNMLANFPKDFFDIKCIYLNPTNWTGARPLDIELNPNDVILSFGDEPQRVTAKEISKLIPNTEGVIIVDIEQELISLDLFRKPKKTVFFVCHDDGFIDDAVKYESIIDVFISHNIAVYDELKKLLKRRLKDVYFIQHGVKIPFFKREHQENGRLKIVFLARHYTFKGIYDLPIINEILVSKGICVNWTILGDGPERNNLIEVVKHLANFEFATPKSSDDILNILQLQDVFILPSRKDGLPVALLESMSVGCVPLIANFSEGMRRVVTEEIGFIVPVGDNDSFAEKIVLLSENRQLLTQLSSNCIEKIKKEFDIKKQALMYFDLYKKYKQFSREHKIGLMDFRRILSSYSSYNRIMIISRFFARKLNLENWIK